jgi:UDP-2,3-diacylglucosamine pyrophosphatase LpxH
MSAIIVSDLHIGLRYFMSDRFKQFLQTLPGDADLVLNGDTVDRRRRHLSPVHMEVLGLIARESERRRVVWVWGNHDWRFLPSERGKIEFAKEHRIGGKLFVAHGHKFDYIMPLTRPMIVLIRIIHDLRVRFGSSEFVHVAFAAKRFAGLYRFLRAHIAGNAVRYAKNNNSEVVACGHTHYAEDITAGGIRYINTGSWTEVPVYCLAVDNGTVEMRKLFDSRES